MKNPLLGTCLRWSKHLTLRVNFHEERYNYGALAVARSALSTILPKNYLPRYTVTFDPITVLTFMDSSPENEHLSLKLHTKKLWTLLYLRSGSQPIQKSWLDAIFTVEKHTFTSQQFCKPLSQVDIKLR